MRQSEKVCRICKIMQPLDQFPKTYYEYKRGPSVGDGHRKDCIKCHSKHTRKNTLARTALEERRAYMKEWRKKNKFKKAI